MKISRPIAYTLLFAVVVGAYFLTEDNTPKRKSLARPASRSSAQVKTDGFDQADFEAKFASVNSPPKNAFRPLVRSRSAIAQAGALLASDQVPADLAGGDPNWAYTGTAEIDGVPTALLENRATLDSEFVTQGQRWKSARIAAIGPTSLTLETPSGKAYRLKLVEQEPEATTPEGAVEPLRPTISGPIGAPTAANSATAPRVEAERTAQPMRAEVRSGQ